MAKANDMAVSKQLCELEYVLESVSDLARFVVCSREIGGVSSDPYAFVSAFDVLAAAGVRHLAELRDVLNGLDDGADSVRGARRAA